MIIIAEAGVNHGGSLGTAKRLVDAAADAGADYVKFQTFDTDSLVSRTAPLAEYQKSTTNGSSQYDMLKSLELSQADHYALLDHCQQRGIKFLSTAFDLQSVDFLASLDLGVWKIPSGEVTNFPYLRRIAGHGGKVIMSTGMCGLSDIGAAIGVLIRFGIKRSDITLLHCNTEYPTPMADVNLSAMHQLQASFGTAVGYSDHTMGIEVPIAAAALGAQVIEKHFTLDKSLPGPDQKASLEPSELKAMVTAIRNIEQAIGDGEKHITPSEAKNISAARKSIVAASCIKAGEKFTEENIAAKRPGTGISPMRWEEVVGATAKQDYLPDQPIQL